MHVFAFILYLYTAGGLEIWHHGVLGTCSQKPVNIGGPHIEFYEGGLTCLIPSTELGALRAGTYGLVVEYNGLKSKVHSFTINKKGTS